MLLHRMRGPDETKCSVWSNQSRDELTALDSFHQYYPTSLVHWQHNQFSIHSNSRYMCCWVSVFKNVISILPVTWNIVVDHSRVQASSLRIEAAVTTPSKSKVFTGQRISTHPLYNPITKSNNLALIEVKQLIVTSRYIRFICLPIGERHRDSPGKHSLLSP